MVNRTKFKKFLLKSAIVLVLYLAIFGVLVQPLEEYITPGREKALLESVDFFEKKDTENGIEVLFLGDSLPYFGVNPDFIDHPYVVHNFSFPGETIQTTYWKVKYYFENGYLKNLKYAVLAIESTSMIRFGLSPLLNYSKFYNLLELLPYNSPRFVLDFGFLSNVYSLQQTRYLGRKLFKFWNTEEMLGAVLASGGGVNRAVLTDEEFNLRVSEYLNGDSVVCKNLPYTLGMKDFFFKLVKLLQSKNVEVVFFQTPSTAHFLKYFDNHEVAYNSACDLADTAILKFIHENYPKIRNLNYLKLSYGFDKEHVFGLNGHLNYYGAKKLSGFLEKDLIYITDKKNKPS